MICTTAIEIFTANIPFFAICFALGYILGDRKGGNNAGI